MNALRRPAPYRVRSTAARVRDSIGVVLLCAGLVLVPFLATVDVGVALGCRNLGHLACVQLFSRTMILPVMNELGKMPE